MKQTVREYDKAILEYMFNTGTFYPYEHLTTYEKTIYLMKIWHLEEPILKGSFNGSEIIDIMIPGTAKKVINPYNGCPLTIKKYGTYTKKSDIYFVFAACEAPSKDGLSSDMPRKLIDVLYISSELCDCKKYLKNNMMKATEESLTVFQKRKYNLCNVILQFNSQFALEELTKQSDKILAVEKSHISESDLKTLSSGENTLRIEEIEKLSITEKSLIKLMCYLDVDSRYELYCQLSSHLKKCFLKCYWSSTRLIIPCKIEENGKLYAAYPTNKNGRHPHPFSNSFVKEKTEQVVNIHADKNMNAHVQYKYIEVPAQVRLNVDMEVLNSVERNKENRYRCVVILKDEFNRDCFLDAKYINSSSNKCFKSDAFTQSEKIIKEECNIECELSIISILINCYKIETRRHIKRELYYLLKRMEKQFSENFYPLDVISLLKNTSQKREKKIITGKDFLVRSNLWKCVNGTHNLQDVIAEVDIALADGTIEKAHIPAAYCATCNLYYILEKDYKQLKQKGIILCRIVKREFFVKKIFDDNVFYNNMNEESILHSLGYNVNAQEDLTAYQRQSILKYAINHDILTKIEICNHLDWLINRSKGNVNMKNAVRKWKEDRDYITCYQNNEIDIEFITSLEVNEYRNR